MLLFQGNLRASTAAALCFTLSKRREWKKLSDSGRLVVRGIAVRSSNEVLQVALSFLDYLLTGTSASPLRKAITDSGLGESIIGGGMDDTLRQPTYSMGLKGVAPDNVEKVRPPSRFSFMSSTVGEYLGAPPAPPAKHTWLHHPCHAPTAARHREWPCLLT
jgi:hypothetical protein